MPRGRLAYVLLFIGFLLLSSLPASAAELHIASDTIFSIFERNNKEGKKLKAAPLYEYLQLDYGNLTTEGLSLHAHGWGRGNLGDNYNREDAEGELLYAYLQYLPPSRNYQLRLGRQYIFEGVARDSIDGIYGKAFIAPSVNVTAYAGYASALESTNGRQGDFIYGGKITHSIPRLYDIGVSYKYIANDHNRNDEIIGTDLFFQFPWNISLLGHSSYNLVTVGWGENIYDKVNKNWGEHSYELRVPWGPFEVRPFFQYFRYDDYYNTRSNSANPFRFLQGTGNTLTVAGAEAFYYPAENWELAFRAKNYDYENRFSTSQFFTALATWKWKIQSEVGVEFGRMQGHQAENRYCLGRSYFFWNLSRNFITGDIMYVNYDRSIYGKKGALFASLGGGVRFLDDALSVKLSFDYSRDAYFEEDFRTMLKVNYLTDKTLKSWPNKF